MIKINNDEVGFIYKGEYNIDKIIKDNNTIFEQGFLREDTGSTPLTTSHLAIGKNLKGYKIYGNSTEDETLIGVGDETKNIFDETLFTRYMTKDGDYWVASFYDVYSNYKRTTRGFLDSYSFKENTAYTVSISGYVLGGTFSIGASYTDGTYGIIVRLNSVSQTVVSGTTNSSKTVDFFYADYGNNNSLYFKYMQIEEGGSATSYEVNGYKIPVIASHETDNLVSNIYLSKPLYKIGTANADYIDFEGQKRYNNFYELTLDGTVNKISLYSLNANNNLYYATINVMTYNAPEVNYTTRDETVSRMYCTNFERGNKVEAGKFYCYYSTTNNICYIYLTPIDQTITTKDGFNNWLKQQYQSGNPFKLYYPIKTTIEEAAELPIIPSMNATTTYESDTEVQPSSMYIKYKGK